MKIDELLKEFDKRSVPLRETCPPDPLTKETNLFSSLTDKSIMSKNQKKVKNHPVKVQHNNQQCRM